MQLEIGRKCLCSSHCMWFIFFSWHRHWPLVTLKILPWGYCCDLCFLYSRRWSSGFDSHCMVPLGNLFWATAPCFRPLVCPCIRYLSVDLGPEGCIRSLPRIRKNRTQWWGTCTIGWVNWFLIFKTSFFFEEHALLMFLSTQDLGVLQ